MMPGAATGRGVAEHWYTDDQFERQLGTPAVAEAIHRRWDVFGSALSRFAAANSASLRVLDAGCGDGINLVALRRILTGLHRQFALTAIDMNPVRAERARVAGRADGRIGLASLTALPFAAASFDVVLCNHVLEHVPAPERGVVEIARVLRPGGLAIIGVPNEGCTFAQLRNHVFQRSILRTTDHVNFFTHRTLAVLLDEGGFTVDTLVTEGFFLPHLRLLGIARAFAAGRAALEAARCVLPSQAAGLIAFATRRA